MFNSFEEILALDLEGVLALIKKQKQKDKSRGEKILELGEEILALGEKLHAPASYMKALTYKDNMNLLNLKMIQFTNFLQEHQFRAFPYDFTPPHRERSIVLASACGLEIPKVIVEIIISMELVLYDSIMEIAYKIQSQWVGIAPMQEKIPITVSTLRWRTPAEKKRLIGDRLYARIQQWEPRLAGKITGMLLESETNIMLCLILRESDVHLYHRINDALAALREFESYKIWAQSYALYTIYE